MYSIDYNISYERLRDLLPESCVCVEAMYNQQIKVLELDLALQNCVFSSQNTFRTIIHQGIF